MAKKSAGILVFRMNLGVPEILLMHPGGPYWAKKDAGAWSIPKGEVNENETEREAAEREFKEETGINLTGKFIELEPIRQSNKIVYAWAVEQDIEAAQIKSNLFEMEWPPKSGKFRSFPEIDKAEWFPANEAKIKAIKGQVALIEQLEHKLQL
ncbi:MAG: NUDIX domain-containing protein [Bacteroidota bacterium]|nr:NUDIX domain-containing protein [Bacteroidota bacterium]